MRPDESNLTRVSKLPPEARLVYLACLAHGLTVAARDGYEVGGTGLTDGVKVRKLNERQHQVTGCLADLLATGTSTWTAEALTEMLLDREDPELARLLEFFVEVALHQAEKCDGRTVLSLTHAQALVLFEWLASLDKTHAVPAEGSPEQKVLRALEGQLEKKLVEPFSPDYQRLLADPRRQVPSETHLEPSVPRRHRVRHAHRRLSVPRRADGEVRR